MTLPFALIFDMDGLLVDSEPRSDLAMEQFLRRRMLDLDPELMPLLLGRRLPEAMVIVKDWFGLDDDVVEITVEFSDLRLAALQEYLPVMPGARELAVRPAVRAVGSGTCDTGGETPRHSRCPRPARRRADARCRDQGRTREAGRRRRSGTAGSFPQEIIRAPDIPRRCRIIVPHSSVTEFIHGSISNIWKQIYPQRNRQLRSDRRSCRSLLGCADRTLAAEFQYRP